MGAGGSEPQMVCQAADPTTPVSLDPASFGCCVDYLGGQPSAAWSQPQAELVACCHEVVGQIDLDQSLMAQIDPVLVAPVWPDTGTIGCCQILGNPCSAPCGCTVWGPPVPRRLGARLWLLDELELAA